MTITAFERSPDGGKGLARDSRVRWALEEADLANAACDAARPAHQCAVVAPLAFNTRTS